MKMTSLAVSAFLTGASLLTFAAQASATDACAAKTINDGVLTLATSNPAYFPWVIDNDPSSGKGFEAAVATEVAKRMGYEGKNVAWSSATFDEGIQPGAKNFDIMFAQYSITPERANVITFSEPYYTAATAVLVRQPTVDAGAKPDIQSLKGLKWGIAAGTTAISFLNDKVGPESQPLAFNDTADVAQAMKSDQIDAAMFDLPTALYISAVELEDGVVLGQFPTEGETGLDQFGFVLEKGNPLVDCVNKALESMKSDGTLAGIEQEWLSAATGVPVIK